MRQCEAPDCNRLAIDGAFCVSHAEIIEAAINAAA